MSQIGDYMVEYSYGDGPRELKDFTWDKLVKMYTNSNYSFIKIESIKNPPYRPIDVTNSTLEALKKLVDNRTPGW